jgi:hypothetical protein
MSTPASNLRWLRTTPGHFLVGLLAVESGLLAAQWLGWFHKGYGVLIAIACVGVFVGVMLLWWLAALVFKIRFQFSLRSLFVLVLGVAVPLNWLATEMRWATERRKLLEELVNSQGSVWYDYQVDASGDLADDQPSEPAWLRQLLGEDFFASVVLLDLYGPNGTDAWLERLCGVAELRDLILADTKVTDAGLEHLRGLTGLNVLQLQRTSVTDAGLEYLKGRNQLQNVDLGETQVTDVGLECLKGLTQLEELNLGGTRVTDAGLKHLNGLVRLRYLYLWHTQVTDTGVKELQDTLPDCKIHTHP